MEKDLIPRLDGRGRRGAGRGGKHQADARFEEIHREQPDHQGERRDHLEVDHRAQADAADGFDVTRAGDPGDERAENQRRDDHLDQAQEELAERIEILRELRVVVVDQRATPTARPMKIRCVSVGPRRRTDEPAAIGVEFYREVA